MASTTVAADDVRAFLEREHGRLPRAVLETLVLGAFQRALISRGRAAEFLGMPLRDFLRLASAAGIPVLDVPVEELAADIERA